MVEEKEYTLSSKIESVEEAAGYANDFAVANGLDEEQISAIDMAVRESVANAIKHGNKFDESKAVELKLSLTDGTFVLFVRDHGTGFNPDNVADPTDAENLLKANGRGILFMNAFMDDVQWENQPDGGVVVKLSKKV